MTSRHSQDGTTAVNTVDLSVTAAGAGLLAPFSVSTTIGGSMLGGSTIGSFLSSDMMSAGFASPGAAKPTTIVTPSVPTQSLYLTEGGDTSAISVNDIHQGQIGDCFLLSPIGELALFHPSAISNMIHSNANGTETVTLYVDRSGALPWFTSTAFKTVSVTVSNSFPNYSVNNAASQDVVGGVKEIWPQVLEKAVATLEGGYGAITNGGYPALAMEMLTGKTATWMSPQSLTLTALQNFVKAGDLITMDTGNSNSLPYNLVGDHAYMFEKVSVTNGTPMVTLGNPWGFDQPGAIPLSQLAKGIVEVDVGKFA